MARKPLNYGSFEGDPNSDTVREGAAKTDANFIELFQRTGNLENLTLVSGTTTTLPPGSPATASVSGTSSNYTLDLGLPAGAPGAGAPTSPDILAIAEMSRLERSLAAAGVPDESSLILDFIRGVHFASKAAITASILTLIAALPGSSYSRASTGTFWGSDGLLKTAANNEPRIEYATTGNRMPLGLLMEPARTNCCLRSEEFDNAVWAKTNVTVSANAAVAPTGTATADRVIETAANGGHAFSQNCSGTNNANPEAVSIVVAAAGRTRFRLWLFDVATFTRTFYVDVDLTAKTVTGVVASGGASAGASRLSDIGGGRFRVEMSGTLGGAGTSSQIRVNFMDGTGSQSYTGDGVSGFNWWGAQLEAGAAPSSYIPTVASAVTRAGDFCALALPSWMATGGTIVVEASSISTGVSSSEQFLLNLSDGSNNNSVRATRVNGAARFYLLSGGATQCDLSASGWTTTSKKRIALAWAADSFALSVDGGAPITDSSGSVPSGLTTLVIGSTLGGGGSFNGHISRLLLSAPRLSNAKLPILSGNAWS